MFKSISIYQSYSNCQYSEENVLPIVHKHNFNKLIKIIRWNFEKKIVKLCRHSLSMKSCLHQDSAISIITTHKYLVRN